MNSINCQCFRDGVCLHQAAPRAWFGRTVCVLDIEPADVRLRGHCAIRAPYVKPNGYPIGPPSVVWNPGRPDRKYLAPVGSVK